MKQRLEQFAANKQKISINFAAAAGTQLVAINGTIAEVGDDYIILLDIYGNSMLIPYANIAYIEIKK